MKSNYYRFIKDIKYDLLVSPFGYDYYNMTKKQAAMNFEWFLAVIPQRMEYFRNRCAADLHIPVDLLDFSPQSLKLVWRWFLQTARMEKTPKDTLEKMEEGAKVFGDSFINKMQFTVVTQFIMKDIAMYVGQSFVSNYSRLHWSYYTKPKNEISAKQPIIAGFYIKDSLAEGDMTVNPLFIVEGAATNFYSQSQSETDIYDDFMRYLRWIPKQ